MNKKMICISIIGLLLITGISTPALGNVIEKDASVEKDTSVVKSDGNVADIEIKGFFMINVKIISDKEIQNGDYKYEIGIKFNEEDTRWHDGVIKRSTVRFYKEPLFLLRFWGELESEEGNVLVIVKIMKHVGNGYYNPAQDPVEKTGTFSRFLISFN